MGRGSAYSDPNNSLEPLTAIIKPYVTSRAWINYLRDPASKADKKRLDPCLPIAKDLQKLHPGLSFRYSTLAQVLKGINQLPETRFIPEDQEEQVCEIHAMMLLTVCRHASKGPLRRRTYILKKGTTKTGEDEVEDKDDEEDGEEDQDEEEEDQDEEEEDEDEDEDEHEHEDEAEKKVVANEKVMAHLAPPCDRFTAFSKRCTTMVDSDDEIDMDEIDIQSLLTVKEEVEEKEEAPAANVTNAQAVDIDKEVNKQEDKTDKNWRLDKRTSARCQGIEVKRAPVPSANLNIALAQGQKGDGNEVKLEYEYGWNVDLRQAWRLPLNGPVPKNRAAKEFVKPTFDPKSNKLDHPMAMFPTGDPWLIPNITVEDCLAWGKERAKPRVKSVGREKDEEEEEAAPDEGGKRKARSDETNDEEAASFKGGKRKAKPDESKDKEAVPVKGGKRKARGDKTNDEEAASVKGGKRKAKDEEIAPVKGSRRKAQDDETDGSKRLKKDN